MLGSNTWEFPDEGLDGNDGRFVEDEDEDEEDDGEEEGVLVVLEDPLDQK